MPIFNNVFMFCIMAIYANILYDKKIFLAFKIHKKSGNFFLKFYKML